MNEIAKTILKRVADILIFGNIIISICTASMVLETYLLLGVPMRFDGFLYLVFFATLFLYNFHRLMGIRRIQPGQLGQITGWAAEHQFSVLMLTLIGAGGTGIFLFQVQFNIILMLIPLGAISLLYELPMVKYHQSFQRIRNLWIGKAFIITFVWASVTALLPAVNAGFSWMNANVGLILVERMLFIFLLALCFDARDIAFDRAENLSTIPVKYGIRVTKRLYRLITAAFSIVILVHYILLSPARTMVIPLVLSVLCTYYFVSKTDPRKSDYYYILLVDGMMILQFLLVWGWSLLIRILQSLNS